MSRKKLSQHKVEEIFKKRGFILLDTYINYATSVKYQCSCGNISKIFLTAVKRGENCKQCGILKFIKSNTYSQEKVSKIFSDGGCELLGEYKNSDTPVKYRCHCGRISKIRLYNFRSGHRCQLCANELLSKTRRGSGNHEWKSDRVKHAKDILLIRRWRGVLKNYLVRVHLTKRDSTYNLLGYTVNELYNHLKSFSNYTDISEIDHIFPIKAFLDFNLIGDEFISIANSLDNLQPLSKTDNLRKADKYDHTQFISWLKTKGIII